MKRCSHCRQEKPATAEHFVRHGDGLSHRCRECHRAYAIARLDQRKARCLCPDCGESFGGRFSRCVICRKKRAAWKKQRRAKKEAA